MRTVGFNSTSVFRYSPQARVGLPPLPSRFSGESDTLQRIFQESSTLGKAAYDLGEYDKAHRLYLNALEVMPEGADPVKRLKTLGSLARSATALGLCSEAERYLQTILKTIHGKGHQYPPEILLETYCDFGANFIKRATELDSRDDLTNAERYYIYALKRYEKMPMSSRSAHPRLAELAFLALLQGDTKVAIPYLEKALSAIKTQPKVKDTANGVTRQVWLYKQLIQASYDDLGRAEFDTSPVPVRVKKNTREHLLQVTDLVDRLRNIPSLKQYMVDNFQDLSILASKLGHKDIFDDLLDRIYRLDGTTKP